MEINQISKIKYLLVRMTYKKWTFKGIGGSVVKEVNDSSVV